MAGYIGSKAVNLSTTGADINGDANIDGTVTADGLTIAPDANRSLNVSTDGTYSLILENTSTDSGADLTFKTKDDIVIKCNNLTTFRASAGGDISFYEDTGTTAKFFWSAADERLGIGTSSPSDDVEISTSADGKGLTIKNAGNNRPYLNFDSNRSSAGNNLAELHFKWNGTDVARIIAVAGSDTTNKDDGHITFSTSSTGSVDERMRLDSSGNLLVGKTSTAFGTDGTHINNSGYLEVTNTSGELLYLNRLSNDGDLIRLFKDSAVVGSVGTSTNTEITLAGQNAGVGILDHALVPTQGQGVLYRNNGEVDIGRSDTKFVDLHLSGTIEIENGTGNVGVGNNALRVNTNSYNTAVGMNACYTNSSGQRNTALGYDTLYTNSSGQYNVAIGMQALLSNSTSNSNTAVGYQAGYTNTQAANTFVGSGAGYSVNSVSNTFIGANAGNAVSSGQKNTILGRFNGNENGLDIRTSSNLIVLSDGDGNPTQVTNGTSSDIVFGGTNPDDDSPTIGVQIDHGGGTGSYINIGHTASAGSGYSFVRLFYNGGSIGDISQSGTTGVTYNTTSDRRLKDNIQPIADATDKLMSMKPVTHTWIADPEAPSVHGFIAQEMQEIVPEAVSGDPDGEEMMSMDYGRITPVLVAALQDAHKKIEALEERLAELEAK